MSWLFSQALVEEYLADTCSDGVPCAPLNVMPTAQPFWRKDKTMDVCDRSPFGLTWKRLTADHGEAVLTSFLAAFPARTYQQQGKGPASKGSAAACGFRWHASFAKFDRDSCSWKTHQRLLHGGLGLYSETWPRWGLMRNGECWERPTLERPTSANVSGLWQTPVADDAVNRAQGKVNSRGEPKLSAQVMLPTPTADSANQRTKRYAQGGLPLTAAVQMMPTPTVHGNYNRKGVTAKSGDGLATYVAKFPTPTVAACKGSSMNSLTRKSGRSRENDRLDYAVEGDASNGRLNPPFVEWLMGWPIAWTELKPSETVKFQEWQQQHGGSCHE